MKSFIFGMASLKQLTTVHPDLQRLAVAALELSPIDFKIVEGIRTKERQALLVKEGASKTLNSRHLTGHAIDVAAIVNNKVTYDLPCYSIIATAFKQAALNVNVPIVWGGNWKSFVDSMHFELDRKRYP